MVDERHDTKTTYQVEIRYANNTNETYTFHGPLGAEGEFLELTKMCCYTAKTKLNLNLGFT